MFKNAKLQSVHTFLAESNQEVPMSMAMKSWILLLTFFCVVSPANAQNYLEQAKTIVDTLASPYFQGRGYMHNGDSLAAEYIARSFQNSGAGPLMQAYFQEFPLTVRLFEHTPRLVVNGHSLRAGSDFFPYASSTSAQLGNQTYIVEAGSGVYFPAAGINEFSGLMMQDAIVVIRDPVADTLQQNTEIPRELFSRALRAEIAARMGARSVVFTTPSSLIYGGDVQRISIPAFIVREDAWPERVSRVDLYLENQPEAEVTTANVIAIQKGTTHPDQYIVIMGHYDHLGTLGPDLYFPGANDNASGIAMLLNLASYFQRHPPAHSLVYIAFSGEEQGLIGSRYFVENPPFPLDRIRFLINLDMVASGEQGLMALGGNEYPEEYALLTAINDSLQLGPMSKRSNAPNSDHFFFLQQGVRGFFIYTNKGIQPYHHIDDVPATLNWKEYEDTFRLLHHFIEALEQ